MGTRRSIISSSQASPPPGPGWRARALGIIRRASPHERVTDLDNVRFWITQLNDSGHKNTDPRSSTKHLYLGALAKFDGWLAGRLFRLHKTAHVGGEYVKQPVSKSFGNVEDLLECALSPAYGAPAAQRVIREYLASQMMSSVSPGTRANAQAAIKSFFYTNDVTLNIRNAQKERSSEPANEDSFMTLENFYKMIQNGKPSLTARTVMMIMLQSGMDASTVSDRFNYEGYLQIVKHFETADHKLWNLSKFPVKIKLMRVKTDMWYTTFIDRDAVVQLQEYLTWKETKHGKHDGTKPLFLTKQKEAIHTRWVSKCFSEAADRAGIQEKVSHRSFKIRSHKVRHLLKSTLKTSGCAAYVAEHVLGHKPRDPYEQEAILYPEEMRRQYAKASSRLNISSKVESSLNGAKDPESQEARIRELEDEVTKYKASNAEVSLLERRHQESIQKMNTVIESLKEQIDSLRHDITDHA